MSVCPMRRDLALVAVLTGCTAGGVPAWIGGEPRAAAPTASTEWTEVLVAARDVPAATTLMDEDLAVVAYPTSLAPTATFSTRARVVGRVTVEPIFDGEVVHPARLADARSVAVSAVVPPGMRAVSVAGPLAHDIERHAYVDLWWRPADRFCLAAQAVFVLEVARGDAVRLTLLLAADQVPAMLPALEDPSLVVTRRHDLDVGFFEQEEDSCGG